MAEHRLIERMVNLMRVELEREKKTNSVDTGFIDKSIDFLTTYADHCHHGKEEDILFRDLSKKRITQEHSATMQQLIDDHARARKNVRSLALAKEGYLKGNAGAIDEIVRILVDLVELYPRHIGTEDKSFFYPCMDYFTRQEQDVMLQEFWEFDRNLIYEEYRGIVEKMEKSSFNKMAKWRCKICGYVYDPAEGDQSRGIKPGTPFEDLPADWRCPVCNAPKSEFEKIA